MEQMLEQKYPGVVIGAPPTQAKYRLMIFTWFHDEPIEFDREKMKYLRYGEEICPETGRKHLQGYVQWYNPRSEAACCKAYKCWMRGMRGSIKQNDKYTGKDGKITEHGEKPDQGKRTDLFVLKDEILEGKKTAEDILEENPMLFHKYGRTLTAIEDLRLRKCFRKEMTKCTWYWGSTGVGKSHLALHDYSPDTHYLVSTNDKGWWDNYRQQEIVVIQEFRGNMKYSDLLEMIDKWPWCVPRRGRPPMPFTSRKVIITSPMRPQDIYSELNNKDSLQQLMRRIELLHVEEGGKVRKEASGSARATRPLLLSPETTPLLEEDSDTD